MRFGRREQEGFEKPEYDIQHKRGTVLPSSVAQPAKAVSVPVKAQRFVEDNAQVDFDEYPDDRD